MFKHLRLSLFVVIATFLGILLPLEARADALAITSGYVNIGGVPLNRNAWQNIAFDFAGNNFAASGGGSGRTQQVQSPCGQGPCAPGTIVSPNSISTLWGAGQATFNGTTAGAWWFAGDSNLVFEGPGVAIPDIIAPTLTLTTTFTMTGSVIVHDIDSSSHPVIFSTDVSGSGIATLTLTYFNISGGPQGYVLSNIRYDFTAVPEPATMILLGTGLAGLAVKARKRRKEM